MQTFLEWLAESNYVLNKHAKWGIAIPSRSGIKIVNGNTHPTATNHDHLSKEHFGKKTDDMLKQHPGTVRYVSQRGDDGKHEYNFELSTHPKSIAAAHHLMTHPKHIQTLGGPPHRLYFDFKDKPGRSFDVDSEYSDDPVKDAERRLRAATTRD